MTTLFDRIFRRKPLQNETPEPEAKDIIFQPFSKFMIQNQGAYSRHLDLFSVKDVYARIAEASIADGSVIDIGGQRGKDKDLFPGFDYHVMDVVERPAVEGVTLQVGDICDCPEIASGSFDVVFSKDVLEHVPDPFAATREMVRICKPGGLIVCITPFSWRFHESPKDYWRFTHQALELLFGKAGATVERSGYDASRRRKNQIGGHRDEKGWTPNDTTPPIDELGGWRENWHAIYLGRKPDALPADHEKKSVVKLVEAASRPAERSAPIEPEFQVISSSIDLKKAIKDAKQKAVSFDLFDTLVVRPFHRPRALFAYIENDVRDILNMETFPFAHQRGKVEKKLRQSKNLKSGTWDEVLLDEIYDDMAGQFGWTSAERDKIMQMEVDAEVSLIRPRQPMAEVLAFARSCNKEILVITDTYLPEAVIRLMMEKCGMPGDVTLFVSSSYGVRKQDGRLFNVATAKTGLKARDILHIGDNPEPDGIQASRRGIKSLILRSPIDRFVASDGRIDQVWSERDDSLSSSIALGVLANAYDHYPHSNAVKKATLFNADPRLLGAHAFGPLVFEFARWVHKRATREGYERLYFLSREGLLFKRAYDLVCKHEGDGPVATYLRASRRSALAAASFSLEDSVRLIFKKMTPTPLRHILTYKLGLDNADDFAVAAVAAGFNGIDQIVELSAERPKLIQFLTEIRNPILSQAATERAAMEAYLASEGLTRNTAARSALVDVGYAGTMQRELGRILGCTPHGLYLGTTEGIQALDDTGARSEGFLFDAVDPTDRAAGRYHEYVSLFEGLLCAPEPSFKRARLDAGKIALEFNDDDVKQDHAERVGAIHDGAIDFVEELLRSFTDGIRFSIETDKLLRVAAQFFSNPQYDEARLLSPVVFDNKMGNFEDKRFLPAAKVDLERALSSGKMKDVYLWEEGVNVMLRRILEEARPGSSAIIDIKSFAALI